MKLLAHLVRGTYVSGRHYYTVVCGECNVVINHGCHYTEEMRDYAEALAGGHNYDRHHMAQLAVAQ